MRSVFWILIIIISNQAKAQNQNSIWCFGDSAGIDFSASPISFNSSIDARGSCVSIADTNGSLLFYASTLNKTLWQLGYDKLTVIYNKNHQIMDGGDSINGEGWYQELVIIPFPSVPSQYYLFSICSGGNSNPGLFYSVIDMSQNAGLGKVIVKNIQVNNIAAFDALTAVKHGNGRDWWLMFKSDGYYNPPNNNFYSYLISPAGISPVITQSIGYSITTNGGAISFSKTGNKILMTDYRNLIQTVDFDRCTGVLSNSTVIEPENNFQYYEHFRSCFSPSGELIYITHVPQTLMDTSFFLYQYDLLSGNILASRDTVFYSNYPNDLGGLQLGPDNRVYASIWYQCSSFCFPYPDSVYSYEIMNLGVINQPDSLGTLCNFQPFSFYLGGKRAYIGFPNNPDYGMSPSLGSGCDSLVDIQSIEDENELTIFPNPCFNKIVLTFAQDFKEEKVRIVIINSIGEAIIDRLVPSTMQTIEVERLQRGAYVIQILGEKRRWTKLLMKM